MEKLFEKYLLGNQANVTEEDEFFGDLIELIMEFIDTIDIESLNEDQEDILDEILEMLGEEEVEEQAGKIKTVVRGGKRVRRRFCRPGYRLLKGRCVRMGAAEKRVRARAQKRGARKRKARKATIARKRRRSIRKRGAIGAR